MKRSDADRVRELVSAIVVELAKLREELDRTAPRTAVLERTVSTAESRAEELRERIRYLGWSTDEAILHCLSDGSWRRREEIQVLLQSGGAPYRGTPNRVRILTEAGKLEKQAVEREDRGNPFGKWRRVTRHGDPASGSQPG